jgi:hypothetical protein
MPNKNPVITVTTQPEDGAVQVEVAISLRPRRPKTSPDAQIAPAADLPGPPRIPRITRLMALAIKFQEMVDRGDVRDYADLARLGYVTRARLTQIMNLALLAPGLQEELLFATEATEITERLLRQIITLVDWGEQRSRWNTQNQNPIMSPDSGTRRATKMP